MPRESPVSARAIHRALDALGRTIEQQAAEIEHYRRELAAERAARDELARKFAADFDRELAAEIAVRDDLTARLRRAERALAQYTPTVALDLPPATRPDLYAIAGIEGAA